MLHLTSNIQLQVSKRGPDSEYLVESSATALFVIFRKLQSIEIPLGLLRIPSFSSSMDDILRLNSFGAANLSARH